VIETSTLKFLKTSNRKMKPCLWWGMISSNCKKKLMPTLTYFTTQRWLLTVWTILMPRNLYWSSNLTHLTKCCWQKEWTTRSLPVSEHLKSPIIWSVIHLKLSIKGSWLSRWIRRQNWESLGANYFIQSAKISFKTMLKSSF